MTVMRENEWYQNVEARTRMDGALGQPQRAVQQQRNPHTRALPSWCLRGDSLIHCEKPCSTRCRPSASYLLHSVDVHSL